MEPITCQAIKFERNDGGRAAAGYKGSTGDCVVRAVAIASGRPYQEVYDACADIMARMPKTRKRTTAAGQRSVARGVYTSSVLFKRYMERLGFVWTPTMKIGSGCTVHLKHDELPMGRLVVNVSKHLVAVIDRVVHDTYDPSRSGTRCVYGYWSLPS